MNAEINPNILKKVDEQPENIRDFLYEILELEFDKLDQKNPVLKDEYIELIRIYKNKREWNYDFKVTLFKKL